MSKIVSVYSCTNCDAQYPRWVGRCNECGKFGTIGTTPQVGTYAKKPGHVSVAAASTTLLSTATEDKYVHHPTGYAEVDRVLGGGIVPGAVILLTGEPGVGKSTLLLGVAERIDSAVLYVSGEESLEQVSQRLKRLGLSGKQIVFSGDTEVQAVAQAARVHKVKLVIIDSLQTMMNQNEDGAPGSPSQIRAVLAELVTLAKFNSVSVIVIGHVTKEGVAAGPKRVEHMVDVVLTLEGLDHQALRFLRTAKNRYGSTNELGVFEMKDGGLQEINNPSAVFLSERHQGAGSCIVPLLEGSRSLLIEVQALVTRSRFGYPKRTTAGFDANRLEVLLAVLAERAGLKLNFSDVYINLAGGLKSKEPALDLAVTMAVASAALKKSLPQDLVVGGEIGLGGEIRPVIGLERRLQEAARLGFKQALVPPLPQGIKLPKDLVLATIRNVAEIMEWVR